MIAGSTASPFTPFMSTNLLTTGNQPGASSWLGANESRRMALLCTAGKRDCILPRGGKREGRRGQQRGREKRQACFSATPYILFHVLLVAPVVLPPWIFGGPWYRLSKESGWCSFLNRRALRPMAARDDPINVVEPKSERKKSEKKMAASAGAVLLLRAAAAETPDPYCQVRLLSLVQSPFSQACSGSNRPLKTSASEPSSARRF